MPLSTRVPLSSELSGTKQRMTNYIPAQSVTKLSAMNMNGTTSRHWLHSEKLAKSTSPFAKSTVHSAKNLRDAGLDSRSGLTFGFDIQHHILTSLYFSLTLAEYYRDDEGQDGMYKHTSCRRH
jgi:hypothetical protein